MKKTAFILLAILLLSAAAGCGSQSASEDGNGVSAENLAAFPVSALTERLNRFSGMTAFYPVSKHQAAILADKLYLFDLSANEITARMETPAGWLEDLRIYPLNDGYAVVANNENSELECTYLDRDMNVQGKINFIRETGLEPIFPHNVSVSSDGKLLAVDDGTTGLYLFEPQTKKTEQILAFDNISTVAGLTQIAFTDHNQRIVFTGQRIPQNTDKGESIYGSVKLDGSDLFTEAGNDLSEVTAYDSVVLFGQEIPETEASGEAFIYRPASHLTARFLLTQTEESAHLWGSQEGRYYGASAKNKDGWTVRLYKMDSGKEIYESNFSYDIEQYRNPRIYIFDTAEVMVLYFGPLGDNPDYKIEVVPFS